MKIKENRELTELLKAKEYCDPMYTIRIKVFSRRYESDYIYISNDILDKLIELFELEYDAQITGNSQMLHCKDNKTKKGKIK